MARIVLFLNLIFFFTLKIAAQPTITSHSPQSGSVGSSVTINGNNFDATTANNIVYFGTVKANVTAATTNQLSVTVPAFIGYKLITVTTNGLTAYSSIPFITTFYGGGATLAATSFDAKDDRYSSGSNPGSIAVADIDGDGKPELLFTNQGSDNFSVLPNTSTVGNFSFGIQQTFAVADQPYNIAVGDLDGDGKLDVAVVNFNSSSLSVYRNTSTVGSISFSAITNLSTSLNPTGVVIADLNRDGKPEVVTSNSSSNNVSVFKNTSSVGVISFDARVNFTTGGNPNAVAAGDVDGDGNTDIVSANSSTNNISVLRNTTTSGSIAFASKIDYASATLPQYVAIGDVNEDGKPEIVAVNSATLSVVSVFRNNCSPGTISFAAKVDYSTAGSSKCVAIADVDGDGKPDVATANSGSSSNNISVLRNTTSAGSISFASRVNYTSGTMPVSVALNDIDGDGKPELAAANFGSGTISLFRNKVGEPVITSFTPTSSGTGTTITINGSGFTGATAVAFGGVAATSFNIVSNTQITAVVASGASGAISVTGPGGTRSKTGFTYYGPPILYSFTPTSGYAGTTVTITGTDFYGPFNSATASFGGTAAQSQYNTFTEVYATVGTGSSGNVTVTTNYGTASLPGFSYVPPPVISSFTPTEGAAGTVVTINGNNFGATAADNTVYFGSVKANIVSANATTINVIVPVNATYQPISVTANTKLTGFSSKPFHLTFSGDDIMDSSSFAPRQDILMANFQLPEGIALGDVDDDGKLDMVVSNGKYNNVSIYVYRNTSTNNTVSFAPFISYSAVGLSTPKQVYLSDIDGDGKQDVVVVDYSDDVWIFRNISTAGNISFDPGIYFTASSGNSSLIHSTIADINNDGKPEILTPQPSNGKFSILKNTSFNGTISFAPKTEYSVGEYPLSVDIKDYDRDGKVDVIVTNGSSNSLSIFRSTVVNGVISFAPKVDIPVSVYPHMIVSADVDKDGKPDMITLEQEGTPAVYYAKVYKNTSTAGNINFSAPLKLQLRSSALDIEMTDIDGNGYIDIIVSNYDSNYVTIFKNTTIGNSLSFAPKLEISTWNTSSYRVFIEALAAGDLNGDGKPDIVAASRSISSIIILKNTVPTVTKSCNNSSFSFTASASGSTYQWQVNTGSGFVNISNNTNYTGTNTNTLQLNNIPSSWYGYQYRCVVNGVYGDVNTVKFESVWTGAVNTAWEDPANWSCGAVPDINTDVVIPSGTVILNSITAIRAIRVSDGANFTINGGNILTVAK